MRACVLVLALATGAHGETPVLIPQPPLAPEFASLPRLEGTGPAANRINAALARVDAERAAGRAGLTGALSYWERDTGVTFAGPAFLGLQELNELYKDGTPHPESFQRFLTFDLATGAEVDWQRLLPARLTGKMERTQPGFYASDRLASFYLAHVDPGTDGECLPVLAGSNLDFQFALEAAGRAVVMHPNGVAHAERACGSSVNVGITALRALGASADLTAALDSAQP